MVAAAVVVVEVMVEDSVVEEVAEEEEVLSMMGRQPKSLVRLDFKILNYALKLIMLPTIFSLRGGSFHAQC